MYTKISKKLSFLLRHSTNPCYIDLNGGWAEVDVILDALRQKHPAADRAMLEQIVATDEKTRYTFSADGSKIRANQGHSIPGVELYMEAPTPPALLYHGTATRFLESILAEGLKPMSRQWVHLSQDVPTAVKVGQRHGKPVVLAMRAADFVRDGQELYRSQNGVWQARQVPPQYLSVLEEEQAAE